MKEQNIAMLALESQISDAETSIELRTYLSACKERDQLEVLTEIGVMKRLFTGLYLAELARFISKADIDAYKQRNPSTFSDRVA